MRSVIDGVHPRYGEPDGRVKDRFECYALSALPARSRERIVNINALRHRPPDSWPPSP